MASSDHSHDEGAGSVATLVAAAAAGDREAQTRVLQRHFDLVRGMLYKMTGQHDDLDDLQQEVFVRMLAGLPRYSNRSAFSSWVAGICVNVAREHFRQRKRTGVVLQVEESERLLPVEASHENRVVARGHLQALATLSETQRIAIVLHLLYGHTVVEVAEAMGAAVSTTRLRIYYGRKKLAKAWAQARNEGGDDV